MIRESMLAFTLLAGSNAADVVTTHQVIQAGGSERANPWLYGQHAERITPVKLTITVAETSVFVALHRKGHRKAAWAWVAGVVAFNLVQAHKNHQLALNLKLSFD